MDDVEDPVADDDRPLPRPGAENRGELLERLDLVAEDRALPYCADGGFLWTVRTTTPSWARSIFVTVTV